MLEDISSGLKVLKLMKSIMDSIRHDKVQQFKDMQLTAPQGMLIGILSHYGEMKVSDLSEKLGLSNSTVSGIIDRLEKRGLVERIRSTEDRRIVYVNVTSSFNEYSKKHSLKMEGMLEDIMSKAGREEADTIIKGLETLKRLIERQM